MSYLTDKYKRSCTGRKRAVRCFISAMQCEKPGTGAWVSTVRRDTILIFDEEHGGTGSGLIDVQQNPLSS